MAAVFTFSDLKNFFAGKNYKTIIVGDAEPIMHKAENGEIQAITRPGGVSVALEPIAKAANAIFIARGRTEEDKKVINNNGKIKINDDGNEYTLKRIFVPEEEADPYYNGFSNQTLWPLCHVAFQKPAFHTEWFEGYTKVNKRYAQAIREEIKGKTFVWINDYQLCLVPSLLEKPKDTMIGMFWHIPWPAWEIFRIFPQKEIILESLLRCDFLAFHRGYHVRNFMETVERELEVRIDRETNQIHYNKHITTVTNLPMGIDTDVIKNLYVPGPKESLIKTIVRNIVGAKHMNDMGIEAYFKQYKVILGIDRLDYTKGIPARLAAIDRFFSKNPHYIGKVVYVGILATSREKIPSYQQLKEDVTRQAETINQKYAKQNWKPIQFIFATFTRSELINFYSKADICLITPLDDGMNLVSKEFVIASSMSENPGMLVLSQFAGSAIDLTSALIVNPYNTEEVAKAIKQGLEMPKKEKQAKTKAMVDILEERNIYEWARDFAKDTEVAARANQK